MHYESRPARPPTAELPEGAHDPWLSHARTPSDIPSDAPDSLLIQDSRLTQDYVSSMLLNPRQTLATASTRADFVGALLGDQHLAKEAEDDAPLLRQLEGRAAELVAQARRVARDVDAFDVDAVIAVLAVIAAQWPVLLDAMEAAGATRVVVDAMRFHRRHAAIVARSMSALRTFTVTDAMRKRIMIDGGLDLTLELMAEFRTDERVQDRATAVIANVAFGCPHRKRRIARHGAVRMIIDGMATFPDNENIQLRGALTIRNLTYEAQVNQYIAGNEGAVEAIASTLLRFRGNSTNPELRFQCVMALESLCREDDRNRQRIVDIDNLAMATIESTSVLSDADHKFEEFGEEEENVNEDGDIVVDDEQILIPEVTPQYRHGAALCPGRTSIGTIISPSASSSGCSDKTSPSLVLNERKLNIDFEKPADNGEEPKSRDRRRRSIITAVVHAMRRDPDDLLLLETALSLLTLISLHRGEVQLRIGRLGGIHVAIAAIGRHPESPLLVSKASALVRTLCFQESNRSHVTSGLPVLISSAREHHKDADVVREVASAISNAVFEHEKNRASVITKGGMGAIVEAMTACGEKDVMVLEAGVCALRNLIDSSESGAESAGKEGAVKVAVSALDLTKAASSEGHRIVQEQAVLFLVDMARLAPSTVKEMIRTDASDWVENALAKLPLATHKELHVAGDKLINLIAESDRSTVDKQRSANRPSPPRAYGRPPSRGFFSNLSIPRRPPSRASTHPRRHFRVRRSMPIPNNGSESRLKRLSVRFMKNSVLT